MGGARLTSCEGKEADYSRGPGVWMGPKCLLVTRSAPGPCMSRIWPNRPPVYPSVSFGWSLYEDQVGIFSLSSDGLLKDVFFSYPTLGGGIVELASGGLIGSPIA